MGGPSYTPIIESKNQLETAILLEKFVILLAMLNYGTKAERQKAKKEFILLNAELGAAVNAITYNVAERNLGFNEEEKYAIQQTA